MGLFKRSEPTSSSTQTRNDALRKKSILGFVVSKKSRVSEATLAVWRNLPNEIRSDPSMLNFQREAERWKGEFKNKIIFIVRADFYGF